MNLGGLLMYVGLLYTVRAEGDPIPEEMYEKIAAGSVKSINDIRRLLQIDSVDDEEDVYELTRNETRSLPRGSSSHSRVIRSLDAQQAQIAECKPRTEVFEITRQMVDPTNANFIVQPPCVEVERCSGCCNSRHIKCVPSRMRIRHVQVKKIVIRKSKKDVQLVPIPLEDHLECRCEAVSSLSVRSHHTSHEHRGAAGAVISMHFAGQSPLHQETTTVGVSVATAPPPTTIRKEEPPLRPSKKKNKKFKYLPSKKEQRDLLVT